MDAMPNIPLPNDESEAFEQARERCVQFLLA